VIGGAGADVITGSANGDTLTMGAGADSVNGGDGNDTIDGGSGSDTALYGGVGIDSITGGEGSDSVAGGAGNDAIILTETTAVTDSVFIGSTDNASTDLAIGATNIDTITGFTAGTGGDLMLFDIGTVIVTQAAQNTATLSADGATLTSIGGTATAGDVDIVIVLGEYGSYAAVQATLNATAGAITDATNGAIVIWRDGAGATQVFFDTNISAGAGTGTQMATLVGVNTASLVAANFDVIT
jgi:Ca2+-binding RTX toxin-like protein